METSNTYADNPIIPRLRLDEVGVRPETIRHHMNRYNLAASYVNDGDIAVDLCCGTGYGTEILKRAGAETAIGVDLNPEAIKQASATYSECEYLPVSVVEFLESTPDDHQPNIITFFEAIEHLERSVGVQVVDAARKSLADDGSFLISTPRDIRSAVNPDHITQWTHEELSKLLSERFATVEIMGQDWGTGEFTKTDTEKASFFVARCSKPLR